MINEHSESGIGSDISPDGLTYCVSDKLRLTDIKMVEADGCFVTDDTLNLMRHVLRGLERGVLETLGYTKGTDWP
jgi:hypothetical protein